MAERPEEIPQHTQKFARAMIQWMREAADRAAKSKKPDEAVGLLRAAARLEQELTRGG